MYMLARFSNLVASLMRTLTWPSTESGSMSLLETLLPLREDDGEEEFKVVYRSRRLLK